MICTVLAALSPKKLINAEKLRVELQNIQQAEYGDIRGICAHVPTRFGSSHRFVSVAVFQQTVHSLISTESVVASPMAMSTHCVR